jgi:hypothetical protein
MAAPKEPEAALSVTTVELEEVQIAELVTSWVVPSVKVAFAVKAVDVPCANVALAGEIVIAVSPSTVRFAVPLTAPSEQPIVTAPVATPDTMFALTVAIVVSEELQVQTVSRCCVLPSVNVPTACKASSDPAAIPALGDVTAIELSVTGLTVSVCVPVTL